MATTTIAGDKRCVKCGKDVNSAKRMKDSKGHYWCYECGNADEARKGTGLVSPCPKCKAPTHALNLVRSKGLYMCEKCAGGAKGEGGGSDDAKKSKQKLMVALVTLLIGGALIANSMFPDLLSSLTGGAQ